MGFQSLFRSTPTKFKRYSAVKTEFETYQQLEGSEQIRTAETTIDKILTNSAKSKNRKLRGVTALESLEDAIESTLGLVEGSVGDQVTMNSNVFLSADSLYR